VAVFPYHGIPPVDREGCLRVLPVVASHEVKGDGYFYGGGRQGFRL